MVKPIGFSKKKGSEVLEKYDIDVFIASTPVNVFYTSGLPVLHVAPNPILYVLSNQYPNLSLVRRDGEESAIVWSLYDSVEEFSWINPSEVYRVGSELLFHFTYKIYKIKLNIYLFKCFCTCVMGRWAKPEVIATGILYLATEDSSYMTGADLRLDGGWTTR